MSNTSNFDNKVWYKSVPNIYYVCSLIAMGFAVLKLVAGYMEDYIPAMNSANNNITLSIAIGNDNLYLWVISLSQVIVVTALILTGYIEMKFKTQKTKNIATKKLRMNISLQRLVKGVMFIGFSWILLYLWFAYFWAFLPIKVFGLSSYRFFWVIADLLHASTAYFFFYCFIALEHPNKSKTEDFEKKKRKSTNIYAAMISMGFGLFSIAGRFEWWNMEKIGPILLSFWVGLSMQFFFSKLDSLNLRIKKLLVTPLYLYILLQMMWSSILGFLSTKETLLILILTLFFKTYFLILFQYWIRSNTFNRFFEKYARDQTKSKETQIPSRSFPNGYLRVIDP